MVVKTLDHLKQYLFWLTVAFLTWCFIRKLASKAERRSTKCTQRILSRIYVLILQKEFHTSCQDQTNKDPWVSPRTLASPSSVFRLGGFQTSSSASMAGSQTLATLEFFRCSCLCAHVKGCLPCPTETVDPRNVNFRSRLLCLQSRLQIRVKTPQNLQAVLLLCSKKKWRLRTSAPAPSRYMRIPKYTYIYVYGQRALLKGPDLATPPGHLISKVPYVMGSYLHPATASLHPNDINKH